MKMITGRLTRFFGLCLLGAVLVGPGASEAAMSLAFSRSAPTSANHALVTDLASSATAEAAALSRCAETTRAPDCQVILSSDAPGFGALFAYCAAEEGCYPVARHGYPSREAALQAVDAECRSHYGVPECTQLAVWQETLAESAVRARGGAAPAGNYKVVRVHYATDRLRSAASDPEKRFGGERGVLSYGSCEVSIPRSHTPGELESPSLWKLEFRADPARHVILSAVNELDKPTFFIELKKRVAAARGRKMFVFIHGYNVSFANAARRTAQISYDLSTALGVDVAPLFYSWPSQATLSGYTMDEANIEWSQANLRGFLKELAENMGDGQIYVVAHSMGNRATTRAMASLLREYPALREKFREIILMAPDVDAEVFKRDIAPDLIGAGRPVTLYASSKDKALIASKKVHGYPRLGEAGESMTLLKGLETIDASAVETDLLGHSYYAYPGSVLGDVKEILQGLGRASSRSLLQEVIQGANRHWQLKPAASSGSVAR